MAQRFLQQAEQDLLFAERNAEIGGFYIAANLAHQAAEKALKAAHWHLRAEEPEWGHRLIGVAARVAEEAGGLPPGMEAALGMLAPVFEWTRYPSAQLDQPIPALLVQPGDAQAAIQAALEVMAWARELLRRKPGRPRRRTKS